MLPGLEGTVDSGSKMEETRMRIGSDKSPAARKTGAVFKSNCGQSLFSLTTAYASIIDLSPALRIAMLRTFIKRNKFVVFYCRFDRPVLVARSDWFCVLVALVQVVQPTALERFGRPVAEDRLI